MKIVHIEPLIHRGAFADSEEWTSLHEQVLAAVRRVEWPPGSGTFTIFPQSGKKRGEGNGVTPIKAGLMVSLAKTGWKLEEPLSIATRFTPGKVDAVFQSASGSVALEWETGNISSSHRALNKMSLGLLHGALAAGLLVVPSRRLYRYLTDRIGNWSELEPYVDLWKSIPCHAGVLEIIVIEHDATSDGVPRITKGTDGRALV